jgi:catechol 2,3-dioxygenase-like lactoylglutathione lyase family enzyme
MTADKDFKRLVRAKARLSGQSYSAVQRRLRTHGEQPSPEIQPMNIVRTIPDIRSLDMTASRAFYEGLLGFKVVMDTAGMLMFASATQPKQQVTINADAAGAIPLPPGFAVDVGYPESVTEIHAQAVARGCIIIEALADTPMGMRRFSLLDPNGARVTIVAHLDAAYQPERGTK